MHAVQAKPLHADAPLEFTVLRVPFFLEPDYPKGPEFEETNRVRLVRKWGGEAGWKVQKARHGLKERGRAVGIEHFNLDRIASNTFASHRLVQWVTRTMGVTAAEQLYSDLNHRHFELGQKLNDTAMLVEAAAAVGADAAEAEAFLASDDGTEQIQRVQGMLRSMGVHSIPTFVVGAERVVGGAAHADDFERLFRSIEEEGGGAPESLFAAALEIPTQVLEEPLALQQQQQRQQVQ